MKKVIVTGATGFVGSWVTKELLANGIEVIAVVRENSHNLEKLQGQNVKIVFCNLSNMSSLPQLIEDRDIDTVYHFGWQGVSDEDISKMAAVNSNTQLYKQFGNSIVVDVMCAMFRNLNIEQEVK